MLFHQYEELLNIINQTKLIVLKAQSGHNTVDSSIFLSEVAVNLTILREEVERKHTEDLEESQHKAFYFAYIGRLEELLGSIQTASTVFLQKSYAIKIAPFDQYLYLDDRNQQIHYSKTNKTYFIIEHHSPNVDPGATYRTLDNDRKCFYLKIKDVGYLVEHEGKISITSNHEGNYWYFNATREPGELFLTSKHRYMIARSLESREVRLCLAQNQEDRAAIIFESFAPNQELADISLAITRLKFPQLSNYQNLDNLLPGLCEAENQSLVIILGNTKAGKSSFTNYEAFDCEFSYDEDTGLKFKNPPERYAKMGENIVIPETMDPGVYKIATLPGVAILDSPGFEERACTYRQAFGMFFAKEIAKEIKSVVIVITYDELHARAGEPFKILYKTLNEIFHQVDFPVIRENILFLFNAKERDDLNKRHFIRRVQRFKDANNENLLKKRAELAPIQAEIARRNASIEPGLWGAISQFIPDLSHFLQPDVANLSNEDLAKREEELRSEIEESEQHLAILNMITEENSFLWSKAKDNDLTCKQEVTAYLRSKHSNIPKTALRFEQLSLEVYNYQAELALSAEVPRRILVNLLEKQSGIERLRAKIKNKITVLQEGYGDGINAIINQANNLVLRLMQQRNELESYLTEIPYYDICLPQQSANWKNFWHASATVKPKDLITFTRLDLKSELEITDTSGQWKIKKTSTPDTDYASGIQSIDNKKRYVNYSITYRAQKAFRDIPENVVIGRVYGLRLDDTANGASNFPALKTEIKNILTDIESFQSTHAWLNATNTNNSADHRQFRGLAVVTLWKNLEDYLYLLKGTCLIPTEATTDVSNYAYFEQARDKLNDLEEKLSLIIAELTEIKRGHDEILHDTPEESMASNIGDLGGDDLRQNPGASAMNAVIRRRWHFTGQPDSYDLMEKIRGAYRSSHRVTDQEIAALQIQLRQLELTLTELRISYRNESQRNMQNAYKYLKLVKKVLLNNAPAGVTTTPFDSFFAAYEKWHTWLDQQDFGTILFGDLEIRPRLGSGAVGEVFQAKWRDNFVAIKKVREALLHDSCISKELESEAALHAQLRHPNIIAFYGICLRTRDCIIVMELMMRSLYDLLHSEDNLIWPTQLSIAQDICKGLEFLHTQRPPVIHCDLKSANVLLDRDNQAKISDFGEAQVKCSTTAMTPGARGTPPWMAPELFLTGVIVRCNEASDIYSLAIVLWEIASRRNPYENVGRRNPFQLIDHVSSGGRDIIPNDTPRLFAALIQRCWQQRSEDRPNATEVREEIMQLRF